MTHPVRTARPVYQSGWRISQYPDKISRGLYLRTFALFATIFVLLATFAHAQQVDLAVGGSTLLSAAKLSDTVTFQPPVEKSGLYLNVSADVVGRKRHLGLSFDTAWRYHHTSYPYNGETYRPFLNSLNVLFEPRVSKKIKIDFLAGLGVASTRFNGLNSASCSSPTVGCVNFTNSNHFMEDLGAGVRYNFWRHFFVRPEIRYYHIQNNQEFKSDNVFRAGASIGYTIHPN
jgi:opacity protein-like surface antigen